MFDIPMPASALHCFARSQNEPFHNTALLLGGWPWLQRLLDHLRFAPVVNGHARCEAAAFLELLTREHVQDVLRTEVACFAALDPTDPHVEEIWLLRDRLSDALDEAAAQQETAVVVDIRGQADV